MEPDIQTVGYTGHAYIRLQTRNQNIKYLLLFHSNDGYMKEPLCYVYTYIATLVHPHQNGISDTKLSAASQASNINQYKNTKKKILLCKGNFYFTYLLIYSMEQSPS